MEGKKGIMSKECDSINARTGSGVQVGGGKWGNEVTGMQIRESEYGEADMGKRIWGSGYGIGGVG